MSLVLWSGKLVVRTLRPAAPVEVLINVNRRCTVLVPLSFLSLEQLTNIDSYVCGHRWKIALWLERTKSLLAIYLKVWS